MKIELYIVAFENPTIRNHCAYWLDRPTNEKQIYRTIELDVPDLPTQAELDAFVASTKEDRKQWRIEELKAELAKLEAE